MRSGTLTRQPLADTLARLVSEPSYTQTASRLGDEFARWNAPAAFAAFVEGATA
jgi:UDP:flavonoid glycosyltransferase YjiC (YdhE family)